MAPSHVLVPLDGSPLADAALEEAMETYDCRITVLNVVTPIDEQGNGVRQPAGPSKLRSGPATRQTPSSNTSRNTMLIT